MKKILALVLTLVMVLCAVSALAESGDSKRLPDSQQTDVTPATPATPGTPYYGGAAKQEEELTLKILDEATEESQVVLDAFKAAFDAGDVLSALPEDVRAKIPEELTQINEMVTAEFIGDTEKVNGSYECTIIFETLYEADQDVAVLFGKLGGEETAWTVLMGRTNADGAVVVTVPADVIRNLGNDPFVLAVVSK